MDIEQAINAEVKKNAVSEHVLLIGGAVFHRYATMDTKKERTYK